MSGDIFAEARNILDGLSLAEQQRAKRTLTAADWGDSQDTSDHIQGVRQKRRQDALQRLAPGRICQNCGRKRLSSREFLITRTGGKQRALCRRCHAFLTRAPSYARNELNLDGLFFAPETRVHINGAILCELRTKIGASRAHLAELCGWSRSYVQSIEDRKMKTIRVESAYRILAALERLDGERRVFEVATIETD